MSKRHHLHRELFIAQPVERVFQFFSDVNNLETITPPSLHFKIVTPLPVELAAGTLIDYRIRLFKVPFTWTTEIESWQPPWQFVDVQSRGPYAFFRHTHTFHATDGGTRITDDVEYELPMGPIGAIAHLLFVRRSLENIFDYRHDHIAKQVAAE